ncbi:snaclec echicetin subunit beta isoform X2 [Drosophila grimshawi]|uniref:snaclec echicetin subunit beta isoform X2 n=1 Tax=Drosophila grimshawi TaxID=7222 RepID=UPI000C870349|nr:snaclec echicetin subunit beta isoform X2 [Drosophila grimshawi]
MKSLGFALLGLLCCTVLAWAEDTAIQDPPIPPQNETEALPIINLFTYVDTEALADANYGLSLYKMNWFQAEQYCASQEFTLASIPSSTEQAAIMAFIRAKVDPFILPTLNSEPIWTSGTNQAAVSQYTWHSSGARVSYNNFQNTPRTNTNYCMTLNGMIGQWSTDNCRTEHYFLCQKKCPSTAGAGG